tara:strand:+ start:646 stop:1386 length:741 start_codon:yes stop_codon:yes gene_type:complete
MTVQDMHYEFKVKLNKVASGNYPNLLIPEIDWYLNEAQEIFVKQRYGATNNTKSGFETSQKRIDDLRALVTQAVIPAIAEAFPDLGMTQAYGCSLPGDYMFLIRSKAVSTKGSCSERYLSCIQSQHDDLNNILTDPFYSPSFEWAETPIVFTNTPSGSDLVGFTDGTFLISNFVLDYIKHPQRIQFPSGVGGSYQLPDGTAVNADANSELAQHTHHEIVDIAVMLASGDMDNPNVQTKMMKTQINE